MMKPIRIFTTGGTIDKVYFDANSKYEVGQSEIESSLRASGLSVAFAVTPLMRKDSLELTDADRATIRTAVLEAEESLIIITHGTDTMVKTAESLGEIPNKTILFTGALQPALFKTSDALFNIGCAFGAVQCAKAGIYIGMNGRVFPANNVVKNYELRRFVTKGEEA